MPPRTGPYHIQGIGSFDDLFRLYHTSLVGYAYSYLHNREDAEDIVQEVFIRIWSKAEEIRANGNLNSLLFIITRNLCISTLRSKIHKDAQHFQKQNPVDLQLKIDLVALEHSILETIEFEELQEQIDHILDTLPEDHRRFFLMNRNEGIQYADIARDAGISVKTVEKKMSTTLRILRHKLKDFQLFTFLLP